MSTVATPVQTVEERYQNAIARVRMAGVKVRQNVMGCCRSCIGADAERKFGFKSDAEVEQTPMAWTYGGQGGAYSWRDGMPYARAMLRKAEDAWGGRADRLYREARVERIYFNHSGPGTVAAQAVAEAFRAEGFTVEWNGTEYQCPTVNIEWPEEAPS